MDTINKMFLFMFISPDVLRFFKVTKKRGKSLFISRYSLFLFLDMKLCKCTQVGYLLFKQLFVIRLFHHHF